MWSLFDRLEHNVKYVFLFTIAHWTANSITSQQLLPGYLYAITGSNESVGSVSSIRGLTQLIFALPAGFAADYLRRDRVLTFAGVLGVITAVLMALAFGMGDLKLVNVSFGLWGMFAAFQSPAMEALFADSVPVGRRSYPFTLKHMVQNVTLVVGPLCAIALFAEYGDEWELQGVRPLVVFGSLVALISVVGLFQFDDDQAYENKEYMISVERQLQSIERNFDAELSMYNPVDIEQASHHLGDDGDEASRLVSARKSRGASEMSRLLMAGEPLSRKKTVYLTHPINIGTMNEEGDEGNNETIPVFCGLDPSHVPFVLFAADFIVSFGTGMAANSFPVFFDNEFGLTSIEMQWLFVGQPLCIAASSFISQVASRYWGRMPVIVFTRFVGAINLFLMSQVSSLHLLCALFLLRAAMISCSEPLRRSLLMDFVPQKQRARWNSLEGLSMFAWVGSAVIGRLLVEAHGYRVCFFITSLVYMAGVLLELLLVPLTRHAVEFPTSEPPMRR
ncbi:hypothetical protein Poli38472_000819 [Pythium oligandrum]|uniref:Major facilitator superfamily (MFS) profile domain-containing protein n=1 Tax=Pythium oligandrum TaxID=41045 RepID=A0A8K1CEI9_PYTOL|nr:hypothetical protein Poli38472_000819 [Pythium oligandrum]|eukprot:TMW60777.1 hypothetical protein Poli38472_000819 [Pythium oligandrum]